VEVEVEVEVEEKTTSQRSNDVYKLAADLLCKQTKKQQSTY
jgi:hypothetical protein